MGRRRPEEHITDPRNTRMEGKSRRQSRMEASFWGRPGAICSWAEPLLVSGLNWTSVVWDLRHSQQCCWRFKPSGMLRRVDRSYKFVSNWWCRQETGDNYRLVLLTNYNSVDQIKENVIGTACSTYWGEKKSRGLVGETCRKETKI